MKFMIPETFKVISARSRSSVLNDNFIWFVFSRKGPKTLHLVDIHYLFHTVHCAMYFHFTKSLQKPCEEFAIISTLKIGKLRFKD